MDLIIYALITLLVLIIVVAIIVLVIRAKIKKLTGSSISEIAKAVSTGLKEEADLPKGITDLSAVYSPKINRDFPDTGYTSMSSQVKNVLTAYLGAIEAKSVSKLDKDNCSELLIRKAEGIISDLDSKNEQEKYDNIDIHKCGIASYSNKIEEAVAVFEVSVGYIYSLLKDKAVKVNEKRQTAYKVTLSYRQHGYETSDSSIYSSTCPNCGAPVDIKSGVCKYCGSSIGAIADRIWQVTDIDLIG